MSHVVGLVLAGGQSRRMGQRKEGLLYNGRTWAAQACLLLSQLQAPACTSVLVSGRAVVAGHRGLPDVFPQRGPLAGIHAGLAHVLEHFGGGGSMLVLAVDMPLLSLPCLTALHDAAVTTPAQAFYYEESTFPLAIPCRADVLALLARLLSTEQAQGRSLQAFLRALAARRMGWHAREELRNLNTPEDLQAIAGDGTR